MKTIETAPATHSTRSWVVAVMAGTALALAAAAAAAAAAGAGTGAGTTSPSPAPKGAKAGAPTRSDLSGYWKVTNFHQHGEPLENRITKTVEGDPVPLLPEAQAVYDKRLQDARDGKAFADTEAYCLPSGMPRMMRGAAYPVFITQPKGMVVMIFELLHNVRFVYLDQKHPGPDDLDINYFGDSVGHWEGNTLVIDTVGLSAKTTIDKVGLPHSDDLHVVEHIKMTDKDAFEDLITMDDPKTFTRPFSVKATYARMKPGSRISEIVCDNNRNTPSADGTVSFQKK